MRIVVIVLLLLGAHFNLTPFAPAQAGKAMFYWPFADDSTPILDGIGGLPKQSGSLVTTVLAAVAGLCFLGAVLALFGFLVPASWWPILTIVAAIASILLYVLYFSLNSLIPLAIDVVVLWGVLIQNWSVAGLNGS